jgi:hypothetical protein
MAVLKDEELRLAEPHQLVLDIITSPMMLFVPDAERGAPISVSRTKVSKTWFDFPGHQAALPANAIKYER